MSVVAGRLRLPLPLLTTGVNPAPAWTRVDVLLVAVLTLIGLAFRLPGLDHGLWIDEIMTLVRHVRLSPAEIIAQANQSNNHVLYSLAAHYTTRWFGESAWALRLPALLFGVATIPLLYQLGRQVADRPHAFLAALFLALNYQFVWYAQSARGYTGLMLGAILATVLFIRLLATANPPVRLIVGYAVVSALAAWIHLTAVFIVLAHGLVWLALSIKPIRSGEAASAMPGLLALLLSGVLTAALYASMLIAPQIEHAYVSDGTSDFVTEAEDGALLSSTARWVLTEYAEGLQRSIPGGWLAVVVVVAVLLAGIAAFARQSLPVAGLLLLPAVVTMAVVESRNQLLFPRFLFGSAAFLVLVAVRGGFATAGWLLPFLSRRQVLLAGVAVALAGATLVPRAWQPKQDYTAALEYVAQHRQPGDVAVCLGVTHFALQRYLQMDCEAAKSLEQLLEIEGRNERIWLLYSLPVQIERRWPEIWQKIEAPGDYVKVEKFKGSLGGGSIELLMRPAAPPGDVTPGL